MKTRNKERKLARNLAAIGAVVVWAFCAINAASAQEQALHELNARATTDAVARGVIYQINLRAFTPEGTLAAATDRLPRVAELGATIVYLCPFFLADDDQRQEFWSPRQKKSGMNNPRNPYRMKDFYQVDPEYGTESDLHAFVDAAHKLGMDVLFDMVYLHCGPSPTFLKEHPDFLKRDANGVVQCEAWAYPALNYDSAELREYLLKNMEHWVVDFHVDGFRLDVADGVPKDFWQEARRRLDAIEPGVILYAEGTRPDDQLEVMDLNYGFDFFGALNSVLTGNKPAREVRLRWEANANARPKGARFSRYTDNHDISNDDYENRREKRWGDAANRAALTLCFTMDGTPMLYNGQEIADAERHSIFGRAPIDWSKEETTAGQDRFAFVQELIKLRRSHSALTSSNLFWRSPSCSESVVAYERSDESETILCLVNLTNSTEPEHADYPRDRQPKSIEVLLTNGDVRLEKGIVYADLPEYGYAIVKLTF